MQANGAVLRVAASGPAPVMELVFGHAQWGKYEVFLWDAAGQQPARVRRGLNNDQIADKFRVARTGAELRDAQLTWEVTIGALGSQGQQYSLRVVFSQARRILTPSPFTYTGPLDVVKVIADFVKFEVV